MEVKEALEILKYYDEQPYFFSKDPPAGIAFKMAMQALEKQNVQDKTKADLQYYLDTNEENGVVYIPKFIIEEIVSRYE